MNRTNFSFFLLAVVSVASPCRISAQSHPPTDSTVETDEVNARRLFTAGQAAYEAGRYEAAIAYFEQAYALSGNPTLLYNLGVAAERAGRPEQAVEAFTRYLTERPGAANRAEVEGRIRVLQAELDATTAPAGDVPTPAQAAAMVDGSSSSSDSDPSRSPAAGWAVLGGSGALVATGVVLFALGARDYATVEDADGVTWEAIRNSYERAPKLSNAGVALGAIGIVGVSVGAILVVRAGHSSTSTDVAFTGNGILIRRVF